MQEDQAVAEHHRELAVVLLFDFAHGLDQRDGLAPLHIVCAATVVEDLVKGCAMVAGEVLGHSQFSCDERAFRSINDAGPATHSVTGPARTIEMAATTRGTCSRRCRARS